MTRTHETALDVSGPERSDPTQAAEDDDRRTTPRVPFAGKAYLTYDGRCRCEEVLDVSEQGLLLASTARLRPGKSVKVFLPVPHRDGWRLCLLKGEVARRAGSRVGGPRLGIALRPGEVDTRAVLAQFVAVA